MFVYGPQNRISEQHARTHTQRQRQRNAEKQNHEQHLFDFHISCKRIYENRVPLQFAQRRVQIYA